MDSILDLDDEAEESERSESETDRMWRLIDPAVYARSQRKDW